MCFDRLTEGSSILMLPELSNLGCLPGKAGGIEDVSRSKRLVLGAAHERPVMRRLMAAGGYSKFNWSRRLSSASCLRMYSRITASSRPTVDTKYPRAQKCCPTKPRFRSPYTRAI